MSRFFIHIPDVNFFGKNKHDQTAAIQLKKWWVGLKFLSPFIIHNLTSIHKQLL